MKRPDWISFTSLRLIKENICDKSSVPSVSAISRLLRGRDEEEIKKSSELDWGLYRSVPPRVLQR